MGRLNFDGSVDSAFRGFRGGVDGTTNTFNLVEDGSGDLFVTGSFSRITDTLFVPGFIRLNSDASVDDNTPRYNADGSPDPSSPWFQAGSPTLLTRAKDGTNDWFVVTASLTEDGTSPASQLRRFKADGTPDPNFAAGQVSGGITLILPAPDNTGDVYVAGEYTTYNSVPVGHLVRIKRDGGRR